MAKLKLGSKAFVGNVTMHEPGKSSLNAIADCNRGHNSELTLILCAGQEWTWPVHGCVSRGCRPTVPEIVLRRAVKA